MAPHPGLNMWTLLWVPTVCGVVTNAISDVAAQCLERRLGFGKQGRRRRRGERLRPGADFAGDGGEEARQQPARAARAADDGGGDDDELPAADAGADAGGEYVKEALPVRELDRGRLFRFCSTSVMLLAGVRWQAWCVALEAMFPGRSLHAVFYKMLLTKTTYTPMLTAISLAIPSWMEYRSCSAVCAKLRQDFCTAYGAGLAYYTPLETLMFRVAPGDSLWQTYVWIVLDPVYVVFFSYMTARRIEGGAQGAGSEHVCFGPKCDAAPTAGPGAADDGEEDGDPHPTPRCT